MPIVKKRICIKGTIDRLERGESVELSLRNVQNQTVRSAVSRMNRTSEKTFEVSQKGLVGVLRVTRIK